MEAVILTSDEISPEKWDDFILKSPQGMIYHKYRYISILAPQWKAVVVKNGEGWQAAMPLHTKKKLGCTYCLQPIFAQFWGICMTPANGKTEKVWNVKKQLVKAVVDTLPPDIQLMEYHFSPHFDYPQPFYWQNYRLSPRFTYQIDIGMSLDDIWRNFGEHIRRDVRKAEKQGIYVEESANMEAVIAIFKKTSGKYVSELGGDDFGNLASLHRHFAQSNESFVLVAKNAQGEIIAGILFFKYKELTIYYFGGTEPEYKRSGAMSLIIWESIRRVHGSSTTYDFDGSMIESIERFFRGFGAVPVQYYSIRRNRLPIWANKLRQLRQRLAR